MTTLFSDRMRTAGFLLFSLVGLLVVYTVAHELGHALVGLACGQTLTEFDARFWMLDPHVSMSGSITTAQRLVQIAAGTGLPLLAWLVFQLAAPRRASAALTLVKLMSALIVLNTLLTWIGLPIFVLLGNTTIQDDVISFLRASRMPPLLLSAGALSVYAGGWLLFFRTTPNVSAVVRSVRAFSAPELLAGARPVVMGLGAMLVVAGAVSTGATMLAAGKPSGSPPPPPGYLQAARVDLSAGPHEAAVVAEFVLQRPGEVGVFLALRNVDTEYLDVQLHGPGGFRNMLFHAEGYRARLDTSHSRTELAAGTHQVVLTASRSPGTASVFLDTPFAAASP